MPQAHLQAVTNRVEQVVKAGDKSVQQTDPELQSPARKGKSPAKPANPTHPGSAATSGATPHGKKVDAKQPKAPAAMYSSAPPQAAAPAAAKKPKQQLKATDVQPGGKKTKQQPKPQDVPQAQASALGPASKKHKGKADEEQVGESPAKVPKSKKRKSQTDA